MTGITARSNRNASDAAVNSGLVRQTIIRKGRRFFRAPTRSLRDRLDAAAAAIAAEPEGRLVSRPLLLVCRGIQRFPGGVGFGLHVAPEGRHGPLRSKPRRRNGRRHRGGRFRKPCAGRPVPEEPEDLQPRAADRKKSRPVAGTAQSLSLEFDSAASVYRRYLVCGHTLSG
jgi:hypothetical protein